MKVADGDTVTLLVEKKSYRVRLQGIDAPEAQQPFGQAAKKALSEKVFGHRVTVRWDEKDRYGRLLGQIYLGEVWVNQLMVQDGYAWHYTYYSKDSRLARSQQLAREASRGLWAREQAIAPWDWRRGKRPLLEDSLEASRIAQIVYVTPKGEKFHRQDCHHLGTKGKPEALASVRNRGLTP
ncbi:MAG TPA: nuclease, partial [Verrucomicrobiales bacterium]|nr:nuclease [Verrucomicrobiales bacterium]